MNDTELFPAMTPAGPTASRTASPTASLPTTAELIEVYRQAAAARSEPDQAVRAHYARLAMLDYAIEATRTTPRRFTVTGDLYNAALAEIHRTAVKA